MHQILTSLLKLLGKESQESSASANKTNENEIKLLTLSSPKDKEMSDNGTILACIYRSPASDIYAFLHILELLIFKVSRKENV